MSMRSDPMFVITTDLLASRVLHAAMSIAFVGIFGTRKLARCEEARVNNDVREKLDKRKG